VLVSDNPFVSQDLTVTLAQPGVTTTFVPGPANRETVAPQSRVGRYVRVQLTGREYLQLAEIEVFGVAL